LKICAFQRGKAGFFYPIKGSCFLLAEFIFRQKDLYQKTFLEKCIDGFFSNKSGIMVQALPVLVFIFY